MIERQYFQHRCAVVLVRDDQIRAFGPIAHHYQFERFLVDQTSSYPVYKRLPRGPIFSALECSEAWRNN